MSLNKLTQNISESSLSRLWTHNEKYDCGVVTAFRVARDCGFGARYTKKEKLQRNKKLSAMILSSGSGYGITQVLGRYKEGVLVTKEIGYYLVDMHSMHKLFSDIVKWGEDFEQDSILFIPSGSILGNAKAFLYGTNHCENNKIGFHEKVIFERGRLGVSSPIYTSYINGRPFLFEDVGRVIPRAQTGFGFWGAALVGKKDWQDINVDAELNESK